jgi:hypothetical protein
VGIDDNKACNEIQGDGFAQQIDGDDTICDAQHTASGIELLSGCVEWRNEKKEKKKQKAQTDR